ncbi:hypothetical protein QTP88_005144 [Uroleucon formosanum]
MYELKRKENILAFSTKRLAAIIHTLHNSQHSICVIEKSIDECINYIFLTFIVANSSLIFMKTKR